jgi:hypothetical protein
MPRLRCTALSTAAVLLLAASPASAQSEPPTVTATGNGVAKVTPTAQTDEAITAAIKSARDRSLPAAIAEANAGARRLAAAANLTLCRLISITDGPIAPYGFYYGRYGLEGSFGPGVWCGRVPTYRFERTSTGRRKRVRTGSRRTCRFPREVTASVAVTYATQ